MEREVLEGSRVEVIKGNWHYNKGTQFFLGDILNGIAYPDYDRYHFGGIEIDSIKDITQTKPKRS